ncbi:MAG: chromosomal replication initiator protein DnaA [Actinobacteria bacterium]|nr:chromosomal replication initiator protein DnaA [Actinomycetota bacterium]
MERNINELWKTVLGEIETEVSKGNYITLFKPTSLISLENNTATIAASSNMLIDLLKKRFYQIIKKSLDKHTGLDINIIFVPKSFEGKNKSADKDTPLFNTKNKEDSREEEKSYQEPAQTVQKLLPRVRPDFIFETMAVSSSNQLAFVSAQTVARNLGHSYNPLFIYGPVGVGKTHLMQSIANDVFQRDNSKKIIYITSEEFTNEVVEAIRTNDTARMKKRFRSADLLIIDDVQFIAGKDRVQEELFHTFNILIDKSSQVVLSSDRPPEEIKKLEKRLSSRFSAGLTVDIESPDFELRCAILLIKAKKQGLELPMDVAKAIAEKIQDVRRLEGSLLRVITEAKTRGEEVNVELATKVSNGQKNEEKTKLHADDIIKKVCIFYDIKTTQLKGPKRDAFLAQARQITMYLLKKELGLTLNEIGNLLGGRDHTTVMHGVEKIEKLLTNKSKISTEVLGIRKLFSE